MTTYDERITTEGPRGRRILRVPVAHTIDPTPKRAGWRPFFVNVVMSRSPQKLVYYKESD